MNAEGQYTGMLGHIQRYEADVSGYAAPIHSGDIAYYSTMHATVWVSILSMVPLPEMHETGLLGTLKVISFEAILAAAGAFAILNFVHRLLTKSSISIDKLLALFVGLTAADGFARYIQLYNCIFGIFYLIMYSSLVVTQKTYSAP